MFENLVESGSHKEDLTRKSSFFLVTLAVYTVLITAFIVAGIYLYDAHLENENLELVALVAPVPVQQQEPEQPKEEPKPETKQPDQQVATRTELIARVDDVSKVPDKPATVAAKVPPIPPNVRVVRCSTNTAPVGPVGPVGPVTTGGGGPVVKIDDDDPPPPPPKPTPKPDPPKPKTIVSGGVLNGKAISKPAPPYPPIAKAARASGTVTVQIVVDETGRVISASAVSGHPLLRAAAEGAARQARFTPTQLSGQPVKVSGVITYNFQLQ